MPDCSCDECVSACQRKPGWFAPGEAERAAEFLGVPWEQFRKRLILDFWDAWEPIYVYSPRQVGVDDDREVMQWSSAFATAPCVFLSKGRCTIHPVKPLECKRAFPCRAIDGNPHEEVMELWKKDGNPLSPHSRTPV